MDWLKLFTLLVAVASVQIKADGPKKKIRIHLPQKVKHIHHHKKIYITNHPASSQYAPAYMPSADGAVAVPTNVAMPAVANLLPLNSVELIDESQHRLQGVSPAASKILPLYHARGYYGPNPSEVDDEYDLAPPPESIDSYLPAGYSSAPIPSSPKKVKIVKLSDQPRKKVLRKGKPKRVVVRNRPQPALAVDEELPVTTFHEHFYSDLDSSGTIRKIKKPPRVEKIVDGDTEHIHTYSEEHIHKLVFDDSPKYSSVVGVDPMRSMTAMSSSRPIHRPFKNSQTLIAIPSDSFSNLAAIGPLAAPAQFEYAAYNPRDVTHDHIFHDHGEIPPDVDITKDNLSLPPKVSYNSQGLRISGGAHKRPKNKYGQRTKKVNKPHPMDFSYYEGIYMPNRPKKTPRPTETHLVFQEEPVESNLDDYRPVNNIRYKETKPRNLVPTYYGKPGHEYRNQQASASSPFSVSSTVVHDYKPKSYAAGTSPVQRYADPFVNFKDNNYANNYEYDTYASSSNIYTTEDKNDNAIFTSPSKKGKKKSVSTQNISFGGQDHLTYVDHLEESSFTDDETPTALDNFDQFDQSQSSNVPTPTPFTINESSPVHPYYTVMAVKAIHGDQPSMPAASNDNYQYAEAPTPSTTPFATSAATTTSPPPQPPTGYSNMQSTSAPPIEPVEFIADTRQTKRYKEPNTLNTVNNEVETRDRYVHKEVQTPNEYRIRSPQTPDQQHQDHHSTLTGRPKLKYGDKI